MVNTHTTQWEALEHWSPTLFLAAGVLFVGHAAIRGIEAFTTVPPPIDVFGPTGYVAAILGLFGLYSSLADRTPRTTRIAAITAAVTAPAWALISAWNFGEAAGILPPQTDVIPEAFFVAVIVSTLLMYLLFSIASLRAALHTRSFGLLLLVPAALFLLLIVGGVVLSMNPALGGVIIGGGQALAHGAIGGVLLTESEQTDHVDPASEIPVD